MTSHVDAASGPATLEPRTALGRLTPADVDRLRRVATLHEYPANTVLCHEGAIEDIFYVLHTGSVKVTQRISDTEERLIMFRGPGEFFGEMALVDNSPRVATVTAATEVALIEITAEVFDQVLRDSPTLALALLQNAQATLRYNMKHQIAELQEKNAELRKAYSDLQAAQAELVRSERVKRDLELAAHVQRSLLPESLPHVGRLSFAARTQPAREMGGDFYDVLTIDEHHLGLLVADVSDKSIHAAIFMAIARTLFMTEARRTLSPREVVLAVNELLLLASSDDDMFVTAFYGVLHLDTWELTYVRAGHDRPLLQHADGSLDVLDGSGRFIGMLENLQVEECRIDLRSGDRLVMYTDGVTDATDATGGRYGADRLRQTVSQYRAAAVDQLAGGLFDDVLRFQGGALQFDDITVLVAAIE